MIGIFGYNLGLIQAVLVIYLVKYIQDNDAPIYEGAGYIIAYSITGLVSYYCWALATFRINTLAMRIKSIIPMLLYKKILNVSNLTLSQGNNRGKLANIIASEIDFFDSIVLFLFLVATPLFLFGSFFILGFNIGAAGVIGLLIIILHYPAILFFGNLVGK